MFHVGRPSHYKKDSEPEKMDRPLTPILGSQDSGLVGFFDILTGTEAIPGWDLEGADKKECRIGASALAEDDLRLGVDGVYHIVALGIFTHGFEPCPPFAVFFCFQSLNKDRKSVV